MDNKDKMNFDELNDHSQGEEFNVPQDYFENLASRIQEVCAENDELREIAPTLADIPKYNPFTVPAGYFDELPSIIQEKAVASTQRTSVFEKLSWIFQPRFAAAAGVAIMAIIAFFVMRNDTSPGIKTTPPVANNIIQAPATDSFISVSEDAALFSMDETIIIESLETEDGITALAVSGQPLASQEDIESYLVENDIDVSIIINEL